MSIPADIGNTVLQNLGAIEKAKITIHDTREGKEGDKTYEVQFNPSSISLRARGGGYRAMLAFGEKGKQAGPEGQSIVITMSTKLIIDQVYNADAFMSDKLNLSPAQLAQNIAYMVMEKKGKKNLSVQTIVEGFIGTIRNDNTRNITFSWGSMNYTGVLNNVSAQYVMFNPRGLPVRAVINLSLRLCEAKAEVNSMGKWKEAYKEAFSGDTFDTTNTTQLATNLLNLG